MNDMVTIPCQSDGQNFSGILGTQLHQALGIQTDYRHWFKRMCLRLELREGRDYTTLVENVRRGNNILMPGRKIDHVLTVTAAKEICLVEKSPVCRMLLRQFVEAEQDTRRANEQEISHYKRLLSETTEQNMQLTADLAAQSAELALREVTIIQQKNALEKQQAVIQKQSKSMEQMKPKVDYCDRVLNSQDVFSISAIAKTYDWSGRKLNKFLHEKRIQYKCDGCWVLYAPYTGKGYTKTVTYVRNCEGVEKVRLVMKWTQKGRTLIDRKMREAGWKSVEDKKQAKAETRKKKKQEAR